MNNIRRRKQALKIVKELDAFPKVPESYTKTTASGGGVSIVVFIAIAILVYSEVHYYTQTELKFDYEVDTDHAEKLKLNVDMTIAMRCGSIGADVLDQTGSTAGSFGRLNEEKVYFDLTKSQRNYLEMVQNINDYIKNEYHAIHEFLWKTGYTGAGSAMPPRAKEEKPDYEPDGCRVHGSLTLNKVAGNFHVTAGKSVGIMGGSHAHIMTLDHEDYNFSHRIDHFSFGEKTPGVVNPLDGDLKMAKDNYHMFQYFVQVVPTKVNTLAANVDTFQYSVTENNRSIDHSKGSHGVPGIFIKYDLSSLKVLVREEHKPYWQFLVRLCGIVGGIFATSGMLHSIVAFIFDLVCCRLQKGGQANQRNSSNQSSSTVQSSMPSTPPAAAAQPLLTATSIDTSISNVSLFTKDGTPMIIPTEEVPL